MHFTKFVLKSRISDFPNTSSDFRSSRDWTSISQRQSTSRTQIDADAFHVLGPDENSDSMLVSPQKSKIQRPQQNFCTASKQEKPAPSIPSIQIQPQSIAEYDDVIVLAPSEDPISEEHMRKLAQVQQEQEMLRQKQELLRQQEEELKQRQRDELYQQRVEELKRQEEEERQRQLQLKQDQYKREIQEQLQREMEERRREEEERKQEESSDLQKKQECSGMQLLADLESVLQSLRGSSSTPTIATPSTAPSATPLGSQNDRISQSSIPTQIRTPLSSSSSTITPNINTNTTTIQPMLPCTSPPVSDSTLVSSYLDFFAQKDIQDQEVAEENPPKRKRKNFVWSEESDDSENNDEEGEEDDEYDSWGLSQVNSLWANS